MPGLPPARAARPRSRLPLTVPRPALPRPAFARPSRHAVEAACVGLVATLLASVAVFAVLQPPRAHTGAAPSSGEPTVEVDAGRPPTDVLAASLMVTAPRDLTVRQLRAARRVPGVRATTSVGLGSLVVTGRAVRAASAAPASYRRFVPAGTARAQAVWSAVARGELAATHDLSSTLRLPLGGVLPVGDHSVRLGAVATTVPGVDLVVNPLRGGQLGLPRRNGLVVAVVSGADDQAVARALERILGPGTVATLLAPDVPGEVTTATGRLVGGSVAGAVGGFTYQWFPDGTVRPDPAWVARSIVSADVPILGRVTCHRVLVPQLRGALQEIVDRDLAGSIDADDYGGCFVPRFIDRDPRRGLSLHTWGIAVDLNVSGNQLGTVGTIDRRVVEVFARWGFAWGGHWARPDPMHFELAALGGPV